MAVSIRSLLNAVTSVRHGLGDQRGQPAPYLDRLTVSVELATARSALRQVIALADQAPAFSDDQLRARLADLVGAARPATGGVSPWLTAPNSRQRSGR